MCVPIVGGMLVATCMCGVRFRGEFERCRHRTRNRPATARERQAIACRFRTVACRFRAVYGSESASPLRLLTASVRVCDACRSPCRHTYDTLGKGSRAARRTNFRTSRRRRPSTLLATTPSGVLRYKRSQGCHLSVQVEDRSALFLKWAFDRLQF